MKTFVRQGCDCHDHDMRGRKTYTKRLEVLTKKISSNHRVHRTVGAHATVHCIFFSRKPDTTSLLRRGWTDFDDIRHAYAEQHVDYGNVVEIETGSRLQYGGRLFFPNGSNDISAVN